MQIRLRWIMLFICIMIVSGTTGCKQERKILGEIDPKSGLQDNIIDNKLNFEEESNEMLYPEVKLQGYTVNNEVDFNNVLENEYELNQLKEYFGTIQYWEYSYFGMKVDVDNRSIDQVNSQFPIRFLRENSNSYYTIFRVKEGGRYYVFFYVNEDGKLWATTTCYLTEYKQKSDFKSLHQGINSYEDVLLVDPNSEISSALLSSGIYSYSLLNSEEVLQVEYSRKDIKERKDLIIVAMQVKPREETSSCFSKVLKKDML